MSEITFTNKSSKTSSMKIKRLLLAFMMLPMMLYSISVLAQDKVVTGKVTDSKDGSAIQLASIMVKGTKLGVKSGSDGAFKIKVPTTATTLVVTSVGYASQDVAIDGETVNVKLVQAKSDMNDLVVVAYGTRKKTDLTGSVTAVSAKDFQKGAIASSEQLLQGKVAGLQVTTGGGSAGGGSTVRIRGLATLNATNDPLIVIDGVPVESNGLSGSANLLNTINPNDIESMSVLKDASATALYGSRASAGVIIITSKKGTKGKIRYNFNTQLSLGSVVDKVKVLNGDQIRSIVTADAAASGTNSWKNLLGTANTDWQGQIFQDAMGWDNNISASGAIADKVPFRAQLGYLNQDGILKTNNFNRLSTSLNLSPKLFKDYLSVNMNVKYSQTKNRFADEGAIGAAAAFDPTQPVFATNKYGGYYEWLQTGVVNDLATRNPLGLLNLRNNKSDVSRIIGSIQLDYKVHFLPDLHVLVNLGMDNGTGKGNDNIDSLSATNYKTKGRFSQYKQEKTNSLAEISLFYAKDLKKLNSKIDVLVGHTFQDFTEKSYNYYTFGQNGDTIAGSKPKDPIYQQEYAIESYIGRLNFTLANKYLLTASVRSDASSKFSQDNRTGYFSSFAFAWKLKEEFFKNVKQINELKMRLGWGQTGQQGISDWYPYLPRYTTSNSTAQYQLGSNYYSFYRPVAYDANIKWETTATSNFGLDFAILDNRISGSFEVYQKTSTDLLSDVPTPAGSNFNIHLYTNVGTMESKGYEFSLNTVPVKMKDLTWNLGFNIAYNHSEVTKLLKQSDPNFKGIDVNGIAGGTGNNIGKNMVGYAPGVFFVNKQVYDAAGKPIEGLYEDVNRDGKVDASDKYYYKKPIPDVIFGFNTSVAYKKFTFGLAAHANFGQYLYNNFNSNNAMLRQIKNPVLFVGNAGVNYLDTKFANAQYTSDYYVENASFFKLDNVNIGYNAGRILKDKATLRVQLSVQNVFTITKYSGLDPENSGAVDNTIYPRPRIYSLGFNLDF